MRRYEVLARPADDPGAHEAADHALGLVRTGVSAGALKAALDEAATTRGRVWLLLDGLDEVQGEALSTAARRLAGWATDPALREVVIVVLTREVGDDALREARAPYQRLKVLPLDAAQQATLVRNLGSASLVEPGVEQQVLASLDRRAIPTDLAGNPLLLSLVVLTAAARQRRGIQPRLHRSAVLSDAIDLLLSRRHRYEVEPSRKDAGVRRPDLVRRVLVALALRWQQGAGERWPEPQVVDTLKLALADVRAADAAIGDEVETLWPDGARDLRDELDRHAGVIGRFDGPRSEWGWLHRSLRERLAAEALLSMPAAERAALIDQVLVKDAELEKLKPWDTTRVDRERERYRPWGEVLGLLAGMLPPAEAAALLDRLVEQAPAAAARALVAAEGLGPWQHLSLLRRCEQTFEGYAPYPAWDADDLDAVVEVLRARGDATEALWAEVRDGVPGDDLGVLWYALHQLDGQVDRARFFRLAGRPLSATPTLDVVRVDGPRLTFDIGSPDGVGYSDEHPRHWLTLTRPFAVGRTPVTVRESGRKGWAQYSMTAWSARPQLRRSFWGDIVSGIDR